MNINTIRRIIADNEMLKDGIAAAAKDSVKAMKLIRDRGDAIKELECKLDQNEQLIKDISVNCKEHNTYLKSKLEAEEDKNRQLRYKIAYPPCSGLQEEIWELKDAIVEKNDKIKELQKERDGYKESIELERIEYNTERKETTQFQNDKIKGLKSKLASREKQFDELDGVLDRTRELLHVAMDHIQTQNHDIIVSNKAAEIADEDAEYWWCIHNEDNVFIHRLLDGNNTFNDVLDNCRADVRERDKIIDELKHNRSEFSR